MREIIRPPTLFSLPNWWWTSHLVCHSIRLLSSELQWRWTNASPTNKHQETTYYLYITYSSMSRKMLTIRSRWFNGSGGFGVPHEGATGNDHFHFCFLLAVGDSLWWQWLEEDALWLWLERDQVEWLCLSQFGNLLKEQTPHWELGQMEHLVHQHKWPNCPERKQEMKSPHC